MECFQVFHLRMGTYLRIALGIYSHSGDNILRCFFLRNQGHGCHYDIQHRRPGQPVYLLHVGAWQWRFSDCNHFLLALFRRALCDPEYDDRLVGRIILLFLVSGTPPAARGSDNLCGRGSAVRGTIAFYVSDNRCP